MEAAGKTILPTGRSAFRAIQLPGSRRSNRMEQFNQKEYQAWVNRYMPRSRTLLFVFRAFWTGGLICVIGQLVSDFGRLVLRLPDDPRSAFTAIVMVFLGAFLTGLGVYDKIGSYAGAGSVVPITGFANSVVAPAMEYKPEGYVMGVGAKLFSIAGPVLVYGIGSSILVGLLSIIFKSLRF